VVSVRIKWRELDVQKVVVYCSDYYDLWRDYPSVRDIFYYFVDVLWPNTLSSYKSLSRWLVQKRLLREINWMHIRDGGGREQKIGDYPLLSILGFLKIQKEFLKESQLTYHLPIWHQQESLVLVLLEKEADVPPITTICRKLGVDVIYTRGYSGWRQWFELYKDLRDEKRKIVFVAVTDFDPSGEDIVRFSKEALERLGLEFELEKALLTKEQIERHELPHRPEDSREVEKLKRDPRYKKWPYGEFRVETASFRAKAPEDFRKAIEDAVNKHFDEEIYEETRKVEGDRRDTIEEYGINESIQDAIEKVDYVLEYED